MEKFFDIEKIMELIPHRYPFILVDRVMHFESGKHIVALKNVTMNEPFFQGHFPGKPIMPGVLIVEAMAQAGGILWISSQDKEAPGSLFFLYRHRQGPFQKTGGPRRSDHPGCKNAESPRKSGKNEGESSCGGQGCGGR